MRPWTEDIGDAIRRWPRRPHLYAGVVFLLAAGMGATISSFSIVNALLLRPLPWPAADRLVSIYATLPDRRNDPAFATSWNKAPISWDSWNDVRRIRAFEEIGVWFPTRHFVTIPELDEVEVAYASSSLLSLLGTSVILGRSFTVAEDETEEADAVLLSYEAWQQRFGGREDIIGQVINLSPAPQPPPMRLVAVGVLQQGFRIREDTPEFLLPLGIMAWNGRFEENRFLQAIGRLSPGLRRDTAYAVTEPLIRRAEPATRRSARLVFLHDELRATAVRPLWLMFGGASLLLLVACTNVASILLRDLHARRQEIAVRKAVGATAAGIFRQLTTEHSLIALSAGGVGFLIAKWMTKAAASFVPSDAPGVAAIDIDIQVGLFTCVLIAITAVLLSLTPVFSVHFNSGNELSEYSRAATPAGRQTQRVVAATALALSLALLICALLFAETLQQLKSQPLGFDANQLVVAAVRPTRIPEVSMAPGPNSPGEGIGSPLTRATSDFSRRRSAGWLHTEMVVNELQGLPGVVAAAGVGTAPFSGRVNQVRIHRTEFAAGLSEIRVQRQLITERYFDVMRIALLRGRTFTRADRSGAFVIVSKDLEHRVFGGRAVGQRLMVGVQAFEVIGVVDNVKHRDYAGEDVPTLYLLNRSVLDVTDFVIRTSVRAESLIAGLRGTIRTNDPSMVIARVTTMRDILRDSTEGERFRAQFSLAYALSALLLALSGLYIASTRVVAERRREIGVRLALGASESDVRWLVIREGTIIVTVGILLGMPIAYAASQLTGSLLYGVAPSAPHAFLAAATLIGSTAIVAILVPAQRALRIDPVVALRE